MISSAISVASSKFGRLGNVGSKIPLE